MFKKSYFILAFLIFVVFVGIGDRILPEPMKSASLNTRKTINKNLIGLFPTRESKLKPHERTRKAIEEAEKNK
ncbi:hypothetical protein Riv7116_0298 [Rivularia sp. PCC 7116]|uniref:hypothetical protein n=1 Tax=Rivularia sp. PCC 7116 TaxID=373994 RepID=UPI00029ED509|nr:hypothetical protein [Rivularia sp. PCC 7116]AFY52902.1 hypothetical protein Riv7116_0298 [Rivularia sp. PCC 7116]